MWKALAYKEIRENAWIAGFAALAFLLLVLDNIGSPYAGLGWMPGLAPYRFGGGPIPFVADDFAHSFAIIAAVLAVAIGLRQTAGEALQGTWLLLWRLPGRRAEQLLVKVLAGGGLYLLTAALPIAIFAAWAATPGTHASPFYWSMTVPVWTSWFGMTLLYLGAFLSGLRPGRWCGSRLLPLVAALPPLYFLHVLPPWLTVALVVLLGAGLLVCIVHVASACDDN